VLAHEAGGIPEGLRKGFLNAGSSCDLCVYNREVFKPHTLWSRAYHKFFDPGYQEDIRKLFNKYLKIYAEAIKERRYSSILVMRGNFLDKASKKLLSERTVPLIAWLYDPLSSTPLQEEVSKMADFVYCVWKSDCAVFPGHSEWLPLGYDDEIYKPSGNTKDIDILLSGSINSTYRKRRHVLEFLGRSGLSRKFRCVFVGSTGSSLKDFSVSIGNFDWLAKRVPPMELANLQSRARVCVNVHRDDSVDAINPSFFSIPGSGSCQLAEKKEHFREFLMPGEDYEEFDGEDELIGKLEILLNDEKKRVDIAMSGYEKARRNHSLKVRALKLLSKMAELEAQKK